MNAATPHAPAPDCAGAEPKYRAPAKLTCGPDAALAEEHEQRLVREKGRHRRRRQQQADRPRATDSQRRHQWKQQLTVGAVLFGKHRRGLGLGTWDLGLAGRFAADPQPLVPVPYTTFVSTVIVIVPR